MIMEKIGSFTIRLGLGLLFVWGGLEKLFSGFLGGVGLDNMSAFLGKVGFGFLGEGTYYLAIWLAITELIAGVLILINKKTFYAGLYAGFVLAIALFTVYVPAGNWMQSMIHFALITAYVGVGLEAYKDR